MRKYLIVFAAFFLAACAGGTQDCAVQGSPGTMTFYAYQDADGNNHDGAVAIEDNGYGTVHNVPSSVNCGSITTKDVPEFEMFAY
jgi:hypothetical protein